MNFPENVIGNWEAQGRGDECNWNHLCSTSGVINKHFYRTNNIFLESADPTRLQVSCLGEDP